MHFFNEVHLDRQEHRHTTRLRNLDRLEQRLDRRGRLDPDARAIIAKLRDDPRDDAWYHTLFSLAPPDKVAGEITPAYSMLPTAGVEHMMAINPAVKLILLLRHPVERAWSGVRFDLRRTWFTDHDEAPDDAQLRKMVFKGNNRRRTAYRSIVETYRATVPEAQLLIAFYDDIVERPDQLLEDVAAYIGVDPTRFKRAKPDGNPRPNAAPPVRMPDGLREELHATYLPDIEWLVANVAGVPRSWLDESR